MGRVIELRARPVVVGLAVGDGPVLAGSVAEEVRAAKHKAIAEKGVLGPRVSAFGELAAIPDFPGRETSDELPVVDSGRFITWMGNDDRASAASQTETIRRVAELVYPEGARPVAATTDELAEKLIARGVEASELEKNYYPREPGAVGESAAVWDAFWKINEGWRSLEAWAGPLLGTANALPQTRLYANAWRDFSHDWKTGRNRDQDLHGATLDLQRALNIASGYGYPKAYSATYVEPKPGQGYGSRHHVRPVDAEDQNAVLSAAQTIQDIGDKGFPNPFKLPPWVKWVGLAASGAIVVGAVALWRRVP